MDRTLFFSFILLASACTPLQSPFPRRAETEPDSEDEEPWEPEPNDEEPDEETTFESEVVLSEAGVDAAAKLPGRDASQNRTDGAVTRRADAAVTRSQMDAAAAPANPSVTSGAARLVLPAPER